MTETQTVDLAVWLTKVWDEEERLAKDCVAEVGNHRVGDDFPDGSGVADYDAFPSYPWGSVRYELAFMAGPGHPDAVLARIAADRKILELHGEISAYGDCCACHGSNAEGFQEPEQWPCPTVRLLASPYKGRDGWQEDWGHE